MTFEKTILKNGMRIITVPMADNPSVTILVMVEAGSKYENKQNNGLSHFLEHMVFKGTPRRPKAIDISRELDSIGAHYNAFTSQEFTGYYAKAASKHFDKILDVVSDMYVNPLFDESEIKKEKGVIIEEIRMYQDLPQHQVHEVFMQLLYGDVPAGWNIAGTEENVRSMNRQNFLDYRGRHYVSSATTIVVAGSIDPKSVVAAVERSFSDVPNSHKDSKLPVKEKQLSPQIKLGYKETDQTHVIIGVRSFPILDERMPIMSVLSSILGKGMSSRLFSKMRDQLGICYYVKAENDPYSDHGVFTISAGVDNARVEEAIKGILSECERLKNEDVSEEELKKVKDSISGSMLLELETSESRAEFCGYQEVMKKKVEKPEEMLKKIISVTAKDVRNLANQIFVNEGLNMAIVGKFKEDKVFKDYFKFN